jgi:hypothetical protein
MVSVVIRGVVYDVSNNRNTFVLRLSTSILYGLTLRIKAQSSSKLWKPPTQRHVRLYSSVALLFKPQTPQYSGKVRFRLLHFVLVSFNDAVSCWCYKASLTEYFMFMEHWRSGSDRGKGKYSERECPSATLLNTNSKRTGLGMNPGLLVTKSGDYPHEPYHLH